MMQGTDRIHDDAVADVSESSDDMIVSAVEHADVALLRAAMLRLTGDRRFGEIIAAGPPLGGSDRMSLPVIEDRDEQRYVRYTAIGWLRSHRDGTSRASGKPSREQFTTAGERCSARSSMTRSFPHMRLPQDLRTTAGCLRLSSTSGRPSYSVMKPSRSPRKSGRPAAKPSFTSGRAALTVTMWLRPRRRSASPPPGPG